MNSKGLTWFCESVAAIPFLFHTFVLCSTMYFTQVPAGCKPVDYSPCNKTWRIYFKLSLFQKLQRLFQPHKKIVKNHHGF